MRKVHALFIFFLMYFSIHNLSKKMCLVILSKTNLIELRRETDFNPFSKVKSTFGPESLECVTEQLNSN